MRRAEAVGWPLLQVGRRARRATSSPAASQPQTAQQGWRTHSTLRSASTRQRSSAPPAPARLRARARRAAPAAGSLQQHVKQQRAGTARQAAWAAACRQAARANAAAPLPVPRPHRGRAAAGPRLPAAFAYQLGSAHLEHITTVHQLSGHLTLHCLALALALARAWAAVVVAGAGGGLAGGRRLLQQDGGGRRQLAQLGDRLARLALGLADKKTTVDGEQAGVGRCAARSCM